MCKSQDSSEETLPLPVITTHYKTPAHIPGKLFLASGPSFPVTVGPGALTHWQSSPLSGCLLMHLSFQEGEATEVLKHVLRLLANKKQNRKNREPFEARPVLVSPLYPL